jgi:hypothetical protein
MDVKTNQRLSIDTRGLFCLNNPGIENNKTSGKESYGNNGKQKKTEDALKNLNKNFLDTMPIFSGNFFWRNLPGNTEFNSTKNRPRHGIILNMDISNLMCGCDSFSNSGNI